MLDLAGFLFRVSVERAVARSWSPLARLRRVCKPKRLVSDTIPPPSPTFRKGMESVGRAMPALVWDGASWIKACTAMLHRGKRGDGRRGQVWVHVRPGRRTTD